MKHLAGWRRREAGGTMTSRDASSERPRGRLTGGVRLAGVAMAAILLDLMFADAIRDIISRGRSNLEQGYIFLVPFVAAYLVVIRRSRLRGNRSLAGAWLGPMFVLAAIAASVIGHDRDILALWHAAPVLAGCGLVIALLGVPRVLAILPALLVLFAMIPLPGSLRRLVAQPLQAQAGSVTTAVLEFFGADAVQMGNLIEINGVPVAIGEACDGMRLVMPLAIVIYAFVFSLPFRPGVRLLLIGLSLPVAFVCNVIRLVPTAIAYGYFPRVATEVHDLGGWLMIPLAIALMFGILRALEWLDAPVARFRLALG